MRQSDGAGRGARYVVAVYAHIVGGKDAYASRAGVDDGVARDCRVYDGVLVRVEGEADGAVHELELVLAARVERGAAFRVQADVRERVVAHRDAVQVPDVLRVEPAGGPLQLDAAVARVLKAAVLDHGARRRSVL